MFFNDDKTEVDIECLTNNDWKLIDQLINLLQPCEAATRMLSGDKYCTSSLVIPVVTSMLVSLRSITKLNTELIKIKMQLIKSIEKRFKNVETNHLFTFSNILDPRFKDTCFHSTENKLKAKTSLIEKLSQNYRELKEKLNKEKQIIEKDQQNDETDRDERDKEPKRLKLDLWNFVDAQQQQDEQDRTQEAHDKDMKTPVGGGKK